jgi:hypothetical protein
MNIPEKHVALLMELGYTEPEARFLYVVATHSGYFILRQFLNFTSARRGKRSNLFARKVLNNGHASVRDYLGYGSIYHLFSRTLYGQIEKGNLRNRRKHSFEYIRTRLVLLDFILANPEGEYLETEQDKVTFFCEKLGVAKEFLPGRVYAASNSVFRDVPRDAASLPSAGKRTRRGERGMKDTDHFLTGVPFTSAVNGSIEEH